MPAPPGVGAALFHRVPMQRFLPHLVAVLLLLPGGPAALLAQTETAPIVDSIVVEGSSRLTASQIIGTSSLVVRQPVNYRDIQRAVTALFRTGQFDDVTVRPAHAWAAGSSW